MTSSQIANLPAIADGTRVVAMRNGEVVMRGTVDRQVTDSVADTLFYIQREGTTASGEIHSYWHAYNVDSVRHALPTDTMSLRDAMAIAGIDGQIQYGNEGNNQRVVTADSLENVVNHMIAPASSYAADGWRAVAVADSGWRALSDMPAPAVPAAPETFDIGNGLTMAVDTERLSCLTAGTLFAFTPGNTGDFGEIDTNRVYRVDTPSDTSTGECCAMMITDALDPSREFCELARTVMVHRVLGELTADMLPPTPADTGIIPVTYQGAQRMIAALQALAPWLDGSPRQQDIHTRANNLDLCGEYEALVCSALGWTPRRGHANSRMSLTNAWRDMVADYERNNPGVAPAELVERFTERYVSGGEVNRAAVDHAESHLESHKHDGFNAIMDELGFEPMNTERDYDVQVRVERTITVYQYVTMTRTATSEDEARDSVDEYDIADYLDSEWQTGEGETVYASSSRSDIDDWDIEDVTEAD